MKGKQLVKHTLISRKHVAESFEEFLRPEREYRLGLLLSCGRGGSLGGEDCRGRVGQGPPLSLGLASGLSLHPVSLEAVESKHAC